MGSQREEVLQKRYLQKDEKSDADMFLRVANALADNQEQSERFFTAMRDGKFLPNTPCLINAGVEQSSGQLFACFVLPIEDSMDSIFTTMRNAAIIHKTGGGVGFNFGALRPQNAPVNSTKGVASGAISFMTAYNAATETVKQGGVRRGANMGVFPVTHPDVLEFIKCKDDTTKLNNFNISVAITNDFINAVKNNDDWHFMFNGEHIEHAPIKARKIMDMIVEQAWKNGEPGILFIDEINARHPLEERVESTNPCGEQPLLPYESCCLGSVNLSKFVNDDKTFDYTGFNAAIRTGVEMLDAMIDKNTYPLPQIKEKCLENRKIGIGVMGYADMLIKMGLKYGSEEALKITEEVAIAYCSFSEHSSENLAKAKGSFPAWEKSLWSKGNTKMRNATVTTIAPTGTISIIAECSSGIEPIFAPVTFVNRVDSSFVEIHPLIEVELKKHGLYDKFINEKSPNLKDYLPEMADVLVIAHDVTPEQHVKTQAVWQRYTHNAVSKTINLPSDATREDVYNIYMLAHELGCKGITVYRDGSRGAQVLSTQSNDDECSLGKAGDFDSIVPTCRDVFGKTIGTTNKYKAACGSLYITINRDSHGNIVETFVNVSKTGICKSNIDGVSRMVSVALRSGTSVSEIIDQLKGINCAACSRALAKGESLDGCSCPDILSRAIQEEYDADEIYIRKTKRGKGKKRTQKQYIKTVDAKCEDCGGKLKFESGCVSCLNCGFSRCG